MRSTLVLSALALLALAAPAKADAYDYLIPETGATISDPRSPTMTAPTGNGATYTEVDHTAVLESNSVYQRDWAASGMVVTPAGRAEVDSGVKVAGPGAAQTDLQKATRQSLENIKNGAAGL